MRTRWMRLIWIAPLAILGILVFLGIGGLVVRLLWNWLLPPLFGWPQITFWQALGLLALSRILIGGFGLHGGSRYSVRRRMAERMAERWEQMTPEERERFRQRIRERCGVDPSAGASKEQ